MSLFGLAGDVIQLFRRSSDGFKPHQSPRVINGSQAKTVKNLGWLLRNWKSVQSFDLVASTDGTGEMWALLRDGRVYMSPWSSYHLMLEWLNRPVFRGLPAKVNGRQFTVGG